MITITLSDGTVLNNLEQNGNNFITAQNITEDFFTGKLSAVTVDYDNGYSEELSDCALYHCEKDDNGKTWFVIGEKTERMKQEDRNTELELALTELYEMIIGG